MKIPHGIAAALLAALAALAAYAPKQADKTTKVKPPTLEKRFKLPQPQPTIPHPQVEPLFKLDKREIPQSVLGTLKKLTPAERKALEQSVNNGFTRHGSVDAAKHFTPTVTSTITADERHKFLPQKNFTTADIGAIKGAATLNALDEETKSPTKSPLPSRALEITGKPQPQYRDLGATGAATPKDELDER